MRAIRAIKEANVNRRTCAAALLSGLGIAAVRWFQPVGDAIDLSLASGFRDQDGRQVDLEADVLRNRTALVNFIYTNCTNACPLAGAVFVALQQQLLAERDSSIALVSISADPQRDTPQKLKRWAQELGAAPGWTLLCGDDAITTHVAMQLGGTPPQLQGHVPAVFLRAQRQQRWFRFYGLQRPQEILAATRAVLAGQVGSV